MVSLSPISECGQQVTVRHGRLLCYTRKKKGKNNDFLVNEICNLSDSSIHIYCYYARNGIKECPMVYMNAVQRVRMRMASESVRVLR